MNVRLEWMSFTWMYMNEWMNEWINEWMNEWMNEWLHNIFYMNECLLHEWMSWIHEIMSGTQTWMSFRKIFIYTPKHEYIVTAS